MLTGGRGGYGPLGRAASQFRSTHAHGSWLAAACIHSLPAQEWEPLLPEQEWWPELDPYQRLWLMVFVDALRCAARKQKTHEQARAWLLSEAIVPTSCHWVCEMIGLDPLWTRLKVEQLLASGIRAGISVRGGRNRHRKVA